MPTCTKRTKILKIIKFLRNRDHVFSIVFKNQSPLANKFKKAFETFNNASFPVKVSTILHLGLITYLSTLLPVWREAVLLLHHVTSDGGAAVALWAGPFQLHPIAVEVLDLGRAGLAGQVERILRLRGVRCGERLGSALPGKSKQRQ